MGQFFSREYVKNAMRVFFFGIILGIIFVFLCRNRLQTDIYLLNEEWILFVQSTQAETKNLFVYILFKQFILSYEISLLSAK